MESLLSDRKCCFICRSLTSRAVLTREMFGEDGMLNLPFPYWWWMEAPRINQTIPPPYKGPCLTSADRGDLKSKEAFPNILKCSTAPSALPLRAVLLYITYSEKQRAEWLRRCNVWFELNSEEL